MTHTHNGHDHDHPTGLRGAIKDVLGPHSHDAADSLDAIPPTKTSALG